MDLFRFHQRGPGYSSAESGVTSRRHNQNLTLPNSSPKGRNYGEKAEEQCELLHLGNGCERRRIGIRPAPSVTRCQ